MSYECKLDENELNNERFFRKIDFVPDSQKKIHREIRKLCFSNPGEMMQAEVTDRRSRRVAAQVQKAESKYFSHLKKKYSTFF